MRLVIFHWTEVVKGWYDSGMTQGILITDRTLSAWRDDTASRRWARRDTSHPATKLAGRIRDILNGGKFAWRNFVRVEYSLVSKNYLRNGLPGLGLPP